MLVILRVDTRIGTVQEDTVLDFKSFTTLTFDCYGTLIDWETGIVNAMRPILAAHGIEQTDDQIQELFGELESKAQRPYKRYRDVLAIVAQGFGERLGFTPADEELATFSGSVVDWPAFPDSVESLNRLGKHYDLVILSNVDDDLFQGSAAKLQADFAAVITAQQVGSYKPDPRNFQHMLDQLERPKDQILHVAQSLFHDIAPARDAGLSTVWVNRRHNRPGFGATPAQSAQPDLEVPDLATLAQIVDDARGE
jgi:2-haloacid dehalogenase